MSKLLFCSLRFEPQGKECSPLKLFFFFTLLCKQKWWIVIHTHDCFVHSLMRPELQLLVPVPYLGKWNMPFAQIDSNLLKWVVKRVFRASKIPAEWDLLCSRWSSWEYADSTGLRCTELTVAWAKGRKEDTQMGSEICNINSNYFNKGHVN